MRRYLALQAMESGKSIGSNFLGRAGGIPYGNGMLLNTDTSSSKVGMILNLNPLIAFGLSAFVYHEPLGFLQVFAYALVLLAVIVFSTSNFFNRAVRA